MTQSPIPKALSTMRTHRVEALLMGGHACVLDGAAEFRRDADFAILLSPEPGDWPGVHDPADSMFLDLARAGQAEAVIRGDRGLPALLPPAEFRVVSPAEFRKTLLTA